MKKPCTLLTIFILAALIFVPVYGIDQNITNSTTVPTTIVTTAGLANTTTGTPNTTVTEPVNITVTTSRWSTSPSRFLQMYPYLLLQYRLRPCLLRRSRMS